jgi:hypothetical protein
MNRFCFAIILLAVCITAVGARSSETPRDFDLQGYIDGAIKAGKKEVTVPAGCYRVTPAQGCHLRFTNLADVTIIANGVEMVCTQTMPAMLFKNCRNVRLKGLTVDYDPLPFTEGRIDAMAPDKSWLEFKIIDGYPENQLAERIEIFDPATRELRRETAGWSREIQSLGNHRYRAAKPKGYRYAEDWDTEQVGDILVTQNCYPNGAGGHAVTSIDCTRLTLEDVTLYGASSFGFLEAGCDGSTYLRCKIERRSPESDPVKRGFPRMRSLNADAFHSVNASKGPAIIGCSAGYQGDDCVNIHGQYDLITSSSSNQLRMVVLGKLMINPGDPLEFLPFNGRRPRDATVKAIKPDGPMTDAERIFIRKLHLRPEARDELINGKGKFYKVTLDRAVTLPMGSAVCSGARVGNGFLVKDCNFGHNRSRGILIKASNGRVTGNTIAHGWMAAVLVSPEYWWLEASSSQNVVVRGNKIIGCRRTGIEIVAPGGDDKPLPSGAHRDISVIGNTFTDSAWPNIRVTSTDHLIVRDNRLTPNDPTNFVPPIARPESWNGAVPSPIVVELCNHAEVQAFKQSPAPTSETN